MLCAIHVTLQNIGFRDSAMALPDGAVSILKWPAQDEHRSASSSDEDDAPPSKVSRHVGGVAVSADVFISRWCRDNPSSVPRALLSLRSRPAAFLRALKRTKAGKEAIRRNLRALKQDDRRGVHHWYAIASHLEALGRYEAGVKAVGKVCHKISQELGSVEDGVAGVEVPQLLREIGRLSEEEREVFWLRERLILQVS